MQTDDKIFYLLLPPALILFGVHLFFDGSVYRYGYYDLGENHWIAALIFVFVGLFLGYKIYFKDRNNQ